MKKKIFELIKTGASRRKQNHTTGFSNLGCRSNRIFQTNAVRDRVRTSTKATAADRFGDLRGGLSQAPADHPRLAGQAKTRCLVHSRNEGAGQRVSAARAGAIRL